jgi:prepilin-type N-terminal cleavage/methylation domain-containing protein/prepilin-type processing-associated H-X9-DG protein
VHPELWKIAIVVCPQDGLGYNDRIGPARVGDRTHKGNADADSFREWVTMRIKKGFTLIELLVVISVIAILMAILMPALMKAKEMGKRMVCCNHVRCLGMANTIYADQADGWYVPIMDRTQPGETKSWPANQLFRKLIGYKDRQGPTESDWDAPKEFLCPSDLVSIQQREDRQYTSWLSYGYNLTDWYYTDWYAAGYAGHKQTTVAAPAAELIFTESNDWWLWWKGANYVKGWDVLHHDTIMPYKDVGCDGPTLYRHGEGVNMAFYDGHVEHLKKDKVWSQYDWDRGIARMWSTFTKWPPTDAESKRLPRP